MFAIVNRFISYWYFRYLLVTELYMVEKWERTMFHIVLFAFLWLLYQFNSKVVLSLVSTSVNSLSNANLHNLSLMR